MPLLTLSFCLGSLLHRCCCSCLRLLNLLVPVLHLGLQTGVVLEKHGNPGFELLHLLCLGEGPDLRNDPIRSHSQLRADLLQCLLHRFVLHPGLPDAPHHADEGFLHPFLSLLQLRTLRLRIRSRGRLLSPWLRFRWNRAQRSPRPDRRQPCWCPIRRLPSPVGCA